MTKVIKWFMTQVMILTYVGHKNKSEYFYNPGFKSVTCIGYALEEQSSMHNNPQVTNL